MSPTLIPLHIHEQVPIKLHEPHHGDHLTGSHVQLCPSLLKKLNIKKPIIKEVCVGISCNVNNETSTATLITLAVKRAEALEWKLLWEYVRKSSSQRSRLVEQEQTWANWTVVDTD